MIAWVHVCTVVLIIFMPPIAIWMNLPTNMAGGWLGGVIDKTGRLLLPEKWLVLGKAKLLSIPRSWSRWYEMFLLVLPHLPLMSLHILSYQI